MIINSYNLKDNKAVEFEIRKIYGIGKKNSTTICKKLNILNKKLNKLNNKEIIYLIKELKKYKTGIELKMEKLGNIEKLIKINCYRGIRHKKKLPVRGQRTKNNAKTAKKINGIN